MSDEMEEFKIVILDHENGRVILTKIMCFREDLEGEVVNTAESNGIVSASFQWQEFNVVEDWR